MGHQQLEHTQAVPECVCLSRCLNIYDLVECDNDMPSISNNETFRNCLQCQWCQKELFQVLVVW